MKIKTIANYMRIKESGKNTFYASDFGFTGGEVNALSQCGLIAPTGKTKVVWYEVNDDTMKRGTAKEWRLVGNINGWDITKLTGILCEIRDNYSLIMALIYGIENSQKVSLNMEHVWDEVSFDETFLLNK
jgi:hypothetical protein